MAWTECCAPLEQQNCVDRQTRQKMTALTADSPECGKPTIRDSASSGYFRTGFGNPHQQGELASELHELSRLLLRCALPARPLYSNCGSRLAGPERITIFSCVPGKGTRRRFTTTTGLRLPPPTCTGRSGGRGMTNFGGEL